MMAIIALFIPSLLLIYIRYKLFNVSMDSRKIIITFFLCVIALNWAMNLILFYGFQNSGNIIYKLNEYRNFACKYILLASVIAVIASLGEYFIRQYFRIGNQKNYQKMKNKSNLRKLIFHKPSSLSVILYGIFLILMILTICNKENYHVDETYSYGLANHPGKITINIENGERYADPEEPFLEYLTVSKDHRFDYQNVWENQSKDVHPPLYYALLHSICSLFPGSFSRWYAGSINILFSLLTLIILRKLALELTNNNEKIRDIVSILFIFSSGILSAVSFFRMYILAMFLVTLLIELLIKEIGRWQFNLDFYIKLGLIAILGALTHYYCIVFTFFICIVFCIILLLNKKVFPIVGFMITGILSGASAYRIFPYMLYHMFGGYRGVEAANNLQQSADDFWNRVKSFFNFINAEIFGNILEYIVIALLFMLVLYYFFEKKHHFYNIKNIIFNTLNSNERVAKIMLMKYCLVFISMSMYFLIVSKIAAFVTDRYMFPIYAGAMGGIFCFVCVCLQKLIKNQKVLIIVTALFISVIVINEWKDINWPYLNRYSADLIESSKKKENVDCLYVYNTDWKTQPSFLEVRNYNSITFVQDSNLEMLPSLEFINDKELVVLVPTDSENILETIMGTYSQFTHYSEIGTYGFATTYYLYSK